MCVCVHAYMRLLNAKLSTTLLWFGFAVSHVEGWSPGQECWGGEWAGDGIVWALTSQYISPLLAEWTLGGHGTCRRQGLVEGRGTLGAISHPCFSAALG